MRIVITGSSGFVGTHLTKRLRELGHELILLDILEGIDITKWIQVKNIKKFDVLFHLAAKTFVPNSYKNPKFFYETNFLSTLNMLELCKKYNSKLVYASSYLYGHPKYLPIDEIHPISATNPYSNTKLICEKLCKGYNQDFNLPVIILRPFNIYGPRQKDNFLIPLIIKQANEGKIILKDSRPKRDFVFIDDVINAYIKCIDYNKTSFEIFNIGSGLSFSVKEIVDIIIKLFDTKIIISFSNEARKNEIMDTIANISKAKKYLEWNPIVNVANGIKRCVY